MGAPHAAASAAEHEPGHERDVVVESDGGAAGRTARARVDDRGSARQAVDADVRERAHDGARREEEAQEDAIGRVHEGLWPARRRPASTTSDATETSRADSKRGRTVGELEPMRTRGHEHGRESEVRPPERDFRSVQACLPSAVVRAREDEVTRLGGLRVHRQGLGHVRDDARDREAPARAGRGKGPRGRREKNDRLRVEVRRGKRAKSRLVVRFTGRAHEKDASERPRKSVDEDPRFVPFEPGAGDRRRKRRHDVPHVREGEDGLRVSSRERRAEEARAPGIPDRRR